MDIQNKTVALVGSAKYLKNFKFGNEIDSHDVVVRINKGIDIIGPDMKEIVGKKTNVLYHHLLEDPEGSCGPKFGFINPEKWKKAGVENVFCLPSSNMNGLATGNQLSNLVNIQNVEKLNKALSLQMIDYNFYNFLSRQIKCKPNTGIVAIFHMFSMNPKKISLYGFSFLLDGWIEEYRKGIENLKENYEKNLSISQIEENALNSKRHIQKNQWEFIKSLYIQNKDLIFPDAHMKKILEMKSFNQKEYFSL